MKKMRIFQLTVFLFSVLLATNSCFAAGTYTFSWSPNPEPVEGYWLYWRLPPTTTYSKTASTSEDTGKPTTVASGRVEYIFDASSFIVGENYCFVLTAYEGPDESGYSNEVCLDTPSGEGNTNINMMSRELTEEAE